ncbi:MAG: TaqI-like C-terminal specificity domain-containing protein [Candidatus Thorarchaeota archaeon]
MFGEVKQSICEDSDKLYLDYNSTIKSIRDKIESKSESLENLAEVHGGVGINYLLREGVFKESKTKNDNLIVIRGNDIQRYHLRNWLYFDKNHPEMKKREHRIIDPPIQKIVVQRIVAHIRDHIKITATIDNMSSITFDTVITIIPNNKEDKYYLLGILNSDLISYYFYKIIYNNAIRSMDFVPGVAKLTPILKVSNEEKKKISDMVKELTELSQKVLNYNNNIQQVYEKYSGMKKTKFKEILLNNFYKLLKKDKKIKIRDICVESKDDLLIIQINEKDFLKLQIMDSNKRKYIFYFLDSLDIELLNISDKKIFQTFKELEIDDIEDIKAVNTVVEELEHYDSKLTLKQKISVLENELNEKLYKLYGLNEEEIRYIKDSLV